MKRYLLAVIIGLVTVTFNLFFIFGIGANSMYEIEKRQLSELPSLSEYSAEELPEMYDGYVLDHFPLRRRILKLVHETNYRLFKATRNDSVVIGKDGWLFLNTLSDTSPRDDYQGTNLMSDDELDTILQKALKMQQSMDGKAEIVLLIVPNKEYVYSQYLPSSYPSINSYTRRDQIREYLESNTDITVVDCSQRLRDAACYDDELYHKGDTHWTGKGAYIGMSEILSALNIPHNAYSEDLFEKGEHYEADIANLCGLYDLVSDTEFNCNIDICNEKSDKSVVYIGDSFGWRIKEYLGESFETAEVISDISQRTKDYDVIIIETVERNLGSLGSLFDNCTIK